MQLYDCMGFLYPDLFLFLLLSQHGHKLPSQGLFTSFTDVEALFTVVKLSHGRVQVTDTAASCILLAGDLPVLLEQVVQRDQHRLKVERGRRRVSAPYVDNGQRSGDITGA